MGSGLKRLIVNTRERAMSTDANRSSSLASKGIAEAMRYLLDVYTDANGVSSENLSQTAPLVAEVLSGLMFRPAVGSANATIDAGMVFMLDPDGASSGSPLGANSIDDSVYKLVQDLGVPNAGTLVLTPNSSGQTRIDVVECSRVNGGLVTTENRDTYDETTGLFTPGPVTKTLADSLTYRIRTGSAGGGYPGHAQGWLPLAVCSVPTGTTTWDTVTVWDVRPLVSDRQGVMNAGSDPVMATAYVNAVDPTSCTGRCDAILNGRRVGGFIRRGTPGTDGTSVDLVSAANRDPSTALTDRVPFGAWWVLPLGLPTWRRYSDYTTGSRLPRGPKGILVVSGVVPTSEGKPFLNVTLPTSMGLGAVATPNAALAFSGIASGTDPASVYGDCHSGLIVSNGVSGYGVSPTIAGTGSITLTLEYALSGGTHYPTNARAVLLEFDTDLGVGTGGTYLKSSVLVNDPNFSGSTVLTEPLGALPPGSMAVANSSQGTVTFSRWVELPPAPPGLSSRAMHFAITFHSDNAVLTLGTGSGTIRVNGWRL